jgi:hypothetical protein
MVACAFTLCADTPCRAQSLKDQIAGIFSDVLELQLGGSPGAHGQHFSPANVATSAATIDALSNLISASTSNFTFSSATAGVTYDLSSGVPVRSTSSLGPVFAERAETLGRNRLNVGWNFSFLNQSRLRGLPLSDMAFTFTHEDVGAPGLGDSDNELDTIDLAMNMGLQSTVVVFSTSYGITDRLDLGVALPLIDLELQAEPFANINSFTYVANDSANHFYGGTRTDPTLTYQGTTIKNDAVGVGDVLVRGKYYFIASKPVQLAGLLDIRLPTGDEEDFLGAGSTTLRPMVIVSGHVGDFGPHANLGYNFRTSDLQRDDIEFIAGFDQKLTDDVTFAVDLLGRFQVGDQVAAFDFPRTATISRPIADGVYSRTEQLTNIPDATRDHIIDLSAGIRFAPKPSVMVVGNIIVPLNNGGLRSDVIPTIGIEFTL